MEIFIFLSAFTMMQVRALLNNLISQGDFENMVPALTQSFAYPNIEGYRYEVVPNGTFGWYSTTGNIQVRTKDTLNTIVVDTVAMSTIDTICQNVNISRQLSGHAFQLSYDYLVDGNTAESSMELYWNKALLFSTLVVNKSPINFKTTVFPSSASQVNSVCFYSQSKINKMVGYLIDNVTLTTFMTTYIYFSITVNSTKINTLTLISNFTVQNPNDLAIIGKGTSISINGKQARVADAYRWGQSSQLALQVQYYEQFYTQSQFSINMPGLVLKNKYGYQVEFVETCSMLPKAYHYPKESEDFIASTSRFLINQMKYSLMSFSVISIAGFSLFMLRFICFSSIIIFFVFLDIPMMIAPVRLTLHQVCHLVLGQSTFNLLLELVGSPINTQILESNQCQLTEKVPYFHLHGMEFRDIGFTSSFHNNSVEDFLSSAFNLTKIALLCFLIRFKCFSFLKANLHKNKWQLILFQFLSMGPTLAPVAAIMLSRFSNISSIKPSQKFNTVLQILPPISLTFIAILLFLDFRRLKLIRAPKISHLKKMRLSKHIKQKNVTAQHLCKFKVLQFLTFVLIPFLAGLQSNVVFLSCVMVTFIFKIGFVVKSKPIMKNCEYYPLLLVKIIELLICCIIVYLYVFDLLAVSPSVEAGGIRIAAALCMSLPILYMIGCAIEFIMDAAQMIKETFGTIKSACCPRKIKDEKLIVIGRKKQESIHRALQKNFYPIKNLNLSGRFGKNEDEVQFRTKQKESQFESNLYKKYKWRKNNNLKVERIEERKLQRSQQQRESRQIPVQIFVKRSTFQKETIPAEIYKG